jgi:mRNA-degrading endonuclease toxin of MazEF toxin-antitoxin module
VARARARLPVNDRAAAGHGRESAIAAWIREHGDAHKMTVVSNDDVNNSGARVWIIRCAACDTALRAIGAQTLQAHAACAAHTAALDAAHAAQPTVAMRIREPGDAHKMSVVSRDEVKSSGSRVWTIRCAACDTALRAIGAQTLQAHAACAAHAAALDAAHAAKHNVATWIREHGDAHKMTILSNDEISVGGARVWKIRCSACDKEIRANGVRNLQKHAASPAHARALDPAHAPELKVVAWIREHGDAHKMTVVSNVDVNSSGARVWIIRCAACDTALRATGAQTLQVHAASAAHVTAVASGRAPKSSVAAWIRENGDAHKMTVVSNDEAYSCGARVWTIRCAACDTALRVTGAAMLQTHAACAAHAGALDPAHARGVQRKRSRS